MDDPAAGSWFLDSRTRELAEAGWAEFQMIEAEGGLVEALKGSVIQPRIARARAVREAALKNGAAQILGVTKYVDADVRPAPVGPSSTTNSPSRTSRPPERRRPAGAQSLRRRVACRVRCSASTVSTYRRLATPMNRQSTRASCANSSTTCAACG